MKHRSEVFNMDCVEGMKSYPDKYFDLAIVDPPYGIMDRMYNGGDRNSSTIKFKKHIKEKRWDEAIPTDKYFNELFRVSKNQIIWGGNYFDLPPTRCFVCWEKMVYAPTMSQVEFAWTSFDSPARLIKINNNDNNRIHPTQKPVKLYKWLLQNYAKPGDLILDTHMGSQSSRIAAYDMGFDYVGFELDEDYFQQGNKRFENFISQQKLF
jgi:site-specific DNA-methyltransferase (adenine-specific)